MHSNKHRSCAIKRATPQSASQQVCDELRGEELAENVSQPINSPSLPLNTVSNAASNKDKYLVQTEAVLILSIVP